MKVERKTRDTQTNKASYMSDKAFVDLKHALEDALAFERGERRDLNVMRVQVPRPRKATPPEKCAVEDAPRKDR